MFKDKLIHSRKRHKLIFKINREDKTNNDFVEWNYYYNLI